RLERATVRTQRGSSSMDAVWRHAPTSHRAGPRQLARVLASAVVGGFQELQFTISVLPAPAALAGKLGILVEAIEHQHAQGKSFGVEAGAPRGTILELHGPPERPVGLVEADRLARGGVLEELERPVARSIEQGRRLDVERVVGLEDDESVPRAERSEAAERVG